MFLFGNVCKYWTIHSVETGNVLESLLGTTHVQQKISWEWFTGNTLLMNEEVLPCFHRPKLSWLLPRLNLDEKNKKKNILLYVIFRCSIIIRTWWKSLFSFRFSYKHINIYQCVALICFFFFLNVDSMLWQIDNVYGRNETVYNRSSPEQKQRNINEHICV